MNWRNVFIVALVSLPLLIVLALGFGHNPHDVPSVLPGKAAPECTLKALTDGGESVSLDQLKGRPVVLNFWATWCYPCEAEHGVLQSAARSYADQVHFVGVIYQDEPTRVSTYLKQRGGAYPQLIDNASRCAIDFGVAGVPETFFIDETGRIIDKHVGPLTPDALEQRIGSMVARSKT